MLIQKKAISTTATVVSDVASDNMSSQRSIQSCFESDKKSFFGGFGDYPPPPQMFNPAFYSGTGQPTWDNDRESCVRYLQIACQ